MAFRRLETCAGASGVSLYVPRWPMLLDMVVIKRTSSGRIGRRVMSSKSQPPGVGGKQTFLDEAEKPTRRKFPRPRNLFFLLTITHCQGSEGADGQSTQRMKACCDLFFFFPSLFLSLSLSLSLFIFIFIFIFFYFFLFIFIFLYFYQGPEDAVCTLFDADRDRNRAGNRPGQRCKEPDLARS